MNGLFKTYFKPAYLVLCALVFVVVCLRAFFIPFSHDEASTFFFYIQSDNYLPYLAHIYTNNHVLNSALANICFHLLGSHRFFLRIPNILAFIVLCIAVYRFFKHLDHYGSKILLTSLFLLTFNFLDFFELCRGYGLSLACMVMALSHLVSYFKEKGHNMLVHFSLWWQLALAANLTLVVVTTILVAAIIFYQAKQRILFGKKNLVLQGINLALLLFWIKFSFFYKSKGVLDSGIGEDYWIVSFKSLIFFIFGTDALWLQGLVILLAALILTRGIFQFFKTQPGFILLFNPRFFFLDILSALVIAFYLQKKLMHVNYPEDRTGLFFYVFFVLSLVFFFDGIPVKFSSIAAALVFVPSVVYFIASFNLSSFTHYFYHVVPKQFYTYLESEAKKSGQLFTVGGHPNREMNYAYFNYRGGGILNPMDEPRQMHMNCDYNIALMAEKPFYRFFYDEVAFDDKWHRVLLKRKQAIRREEAIDLTRGQKDFKGNDEFFEFLRFYDSTGVTSTCFEADIELTFKTVPKPFKAFLVLQVNDENNNGICYKRALLNWVADDLDGSTKRFKLTGEPIHGKYKNIVVYLWNIDKMVCDFELKQLKILNLKAPGIDVVIPKNYYPYAKKIINEELL